MNSLHYPTSRDTTTTASMRPLSPNDPHSRYHGNHAPFVSPRQHQHARPTPSSCPVHGHETGERGGHQHGGSAGDERRGGSERSAGPPGLPGFEGSGGHVGREFHSHHGGHPRMREEMQFMHGRPPHPLEVGLFVYLKLFKLICLLTLIHFISGWFALVIQSITLEIYFYMLFLYVCVCLLMFFLATADPLVLKFSWFFLKWCRTDSYAF